MILSLSYYGDPVLRKKALPIEEVNDEILHLAQDMIETMESQDGLGLAAPQVGHSIRMFVICVPEKISEEEDAELIKGVPEVFINPKLSSPSDEVGVFLEGCLSIPKIYGDVVRPTSIHIEAMNLDGEIFKRELTELEARVVMHENDHINGVLFIDRIKGKKRKILEPQLLEVRKEYYEQGSRS
ncbi:MAG: peptide deformylase [Chlamydiales bacterium]|jgi:peptide deformylase